MNKLETAKKSARQTIAQGQNSGSQNTKQGKEQVLNGQDLEEQVRNKQDHKEQDQKEQTILQLLALMGQNSLKAAGSISAIADTQEKIWQNVSQLELTAAQQQAEWKQLHRLLILTVSFLIIGVTAIFLLLVFSLPTTKRMP